MAAEPPGRLISHFQTKSVEQQGNGWSELWDNGENDLWDRGFPSPPMIDLMADRPDLLNPTNPDGSRKRAFVAGCGRGYDPVMLALHGFDAWGLEISETAVETAQGYAAGQLKEPSSDNFPKVDGWSRPEAGSVAFVQGDFFKRDWEKAIPGDDKRFDVIYDYTFLCALLPSMRRDWATRMAQLLRPGGLLVCLEFPLWKSPKELGPPWGLKGVYWDLLACGGDGIVEDDREEPAPSSPQAHFVRELRFNPARSYKQGRGEDMLSVWRRQ
ncbi:S-adenosyl-L-methionine-dependent methyltransferase [Sporormia fimetaria CBS 119925]|uniref:S-adenosyl-L-methionine-dependent methyltransferase n=1 Tax=Sporormia fimetaria CBS 119925 TaxID=1340428 RepID=A0A6A6VN76_9PLEO|nr:S-adenosyl-L-methionine-dependent methyltransferase [Sporormia fimetaria CBS 119925]